MGLTLTPSADAATKFIDWRTAINGDADTSNAQIVDKAFGNLQTDLSSHIGDDTKHITAEERKVWNEKASVKMVNFMLISSGWVGTEAPYSQTVSVSGVTATSDGSVGIADSATDSQWNAAVSSQLRKTAQGADSITIKAYGDKPSLDLPCSITIMG